MLKNSALFAGAAALVLGSLALHPAVAQDSQQLQKRLQTLESQMRAVQRQVFPGGDKRFFPPEITADSPGADAVPAASVAPDASVLTDLGQRMTAAETQQRQMTGRLEELQFSLKQVQQQVEQLQASLQPPPAPEGAAADEGAATGSAVAAALSGQTAAPPAAPAATPAAAPPAAAPTAASLEAEYRAGYALYTDKKYAEAEKSLLAFADANPKHPRASNAEFWAGRAILAEGRTADAAKVFLQSYQKFPRGERAHNSLLWLAKSLIDLKQNEAACQALDQLQASYPDRLTGQVKTDTATTRKAAKCSG